MAHFDFLLEAPVIANSPDSISIAWQIGAQEHRCSLIGPPYTVQVVCKGEYPSINRQHCCFDR